MSRHGSALRVFLAAALLLIGFGLLPPDTVVADTPQAQSTEIVTHEDSVGAALAFLASQQLDDGSIDAFGSGADPTGTALTVLALASNGRSIAILGGGEDRPGLVDYLFEEAIAYTHQPGYDDAEHLYPSRAGLLLAAVAAANEDPCEFGGMDLVAQLTACFDPETGSYRSEAEGDWTSGAPSESNQAWAILGLAAAGESVPPEATDYLVTLQADDGSWAAGDPDTSARVLLALLASGNASPTDDVIIRALAYFDDTQLENGGWRPSWDTDPLNADTTGWVVQALRAAGYVPPAAFGHQGADPVEALRALQQEDGRIGGTYANAYSTAEALLGLAEESVCFLGRTARSRQALTWLHGQQNEGGSWSGFSGADPGATCEVVLAYAASGFDPATVLSSAHASPIDYLISEGPRYAETGPAAAGKLAVATVAAGLNPRDIGGFDVVDLLATTWYSPTLGAFGTITDTLDTWAQAWAIMGLASADETVPAEAVGTLKTLQADEGNWTDAWGYSAPDSTGLALQALAAAGVSVDDASVASGIAYLHDAQDARGGWENANSTAAAIQGLVAVGEDLTTEEWLRNGHGPFDALASYQKTDGPFVWMWDSPFGLPVDDAFATRQAVPALVGVHYPYVPAGLEAFDDAATLPDPDRLLAGEPLLTRDQGLSITVPFAGDRNGDASVTLDYREVGATDWITGTKVVRTERAFVATVALEERPRYELAASVSDPDGVQHEGRIVASLEVVTEIPAAPEQPMATVEPSQVSDTVPAVGLVVHLGPDNVVSVCVPLGESEQMSGLDVLLASGLDVAASYSSLGALVCAIEGVGCAVDDCFCKSPETWSYWHMMDGEWVYSSVGASAYMVKAGDIEGWSWGGTEAPPVLSLEDICAAETQATPQPVEPTVAETTAEATATIERKAPATLTVGAGATEAPTSVAETPTTVPSLGAEDAQASGVPIEYVILGLLVVALGVVLVVIRRRRA